MTRRQEYEPGGDFKTYAEIRWSQTSSGDIAEVTNQRTPP